MITDAIFQLNSLPVIASIILTTSTPNGSVLGIFLRRYFKKIRLQRVVGTYLAGFAFFAGIVLPQATSFTNSLALTYKPIDASIDFERSASLYQWPFPSFGISQYFSLLHPGMDLTNPQGTPIYPVAGGIVEWTASIPYGYGTHVMISHDNGMNSLYAHLTSATVRAGERVYKQTVIGYVGTTGWSTGSHLHLELYQNAIPTNPLDVLPEINTQAIDN